MSNKTVFVKSCGCGDLACWSCFLQADQERPFGKDSDSCESSEVTLTHHELAQIYKHWVWQEIECNRIIYRDPGPMTFPEWTTVVVAKHRRREIQRVIGEIAARKALAEVVADLAMDQRHVLLNGPGWKKHLLLEEFEKNGKLRLAHIENHQRVKQSTGAGEGNSDAHDSGDEEAYDQIDEKDVAI